MSDRLDNFGMDDPKMSRIKEDMEVYDRNGKKLGRVETVHFGDAGSSQLDRGKGAAEARNYNTSDQNDLWDAIAEAIDPEENLEEVVRDRLIREGFVRINNSSLIGGDLFATPDQIERVDQDNVHLRVDRDDLIER